MNDRDGEWPWTIQADLKCIVITSVLVRSFDGRGEGQVPVEVETGLMWPHAKKSWRPAEAEGSGTLPWGPQEEPALLTPWLQPHKAHLTLLASKAQDGQAELLCAAVSVEMCLAAVRSSPRSHYQSYSGYPWRKWSGGGWETFLRGLCWAFTVAHGFSCPEACGILLPWQGIKPKSPALEGRFLTTGPLWKSQNKVFYSCLSLLCCWCACKTLIYNIFLIKK